MGLEKELSMFKILATRTLNMILIDGWVPKKKKKIPPSSDIGKETYIYASET